MPRKQHLQYLRPDIQAEPLIDSWYAWTYMIPPATRARNLTERNIRTMESYIAAPEVHAMAVKNPKMLGGPFVDYNGKRVEEVEQLLRHTIASRQGLLQLSEALVKLDQLIESHARGDSLRLVYLKVPELLRGCVELFYDLYNNISYRIIEPLMYNAWRDREQGQSIALSRTVGDDRPFILSTPRLPSETALELTIPFRSNILDKLFAAKRSPKECDSLMEQCGLLSRDHELFRSMFTCDAPKQYTKYSGSGVRWRYFGHACILIETQTSSYLFDPMLSYTYESSISRYTYEDLPEHIEYVFITHNHNDHVLLETLLQLRERIGYVVVPRNGGGMLADPSLKLILQEIGFKNVLEITELQTIPLNDGYVMGLPFFGEHADLNVQSKIAYLLEINGNKLMFAADSCNFEPTLYQRLREIVGSVRALFIGMECDGSPGSWLYGPLYGKRLPWAYDQARRMNGANCDEVISILDSIECREVFVYAMGQEPWLNYLLCVKYTDESNPIVQSNQLIQRCRDRGIAAERLFGERELVLE